MTTRLLVAHGESVIRYGFARLVATSAQLRVIGEATSRDEVLDLVEAHDPEVVLAHVDLPPTGVLDLLDELAVRRGADVPAVVVIGGRGHEDDVLRALVAGASGYVAMDADTGQLVQIVQCCAAGGIAVTAAAGRRLVGRCAQRVEQTARVRDLTVLTPREREVVAAIARGLSNAEIASVLGISVSTVNTHTAHVHRKLGTRRRTQLALVVTDRDE